MKRQQEIAIIKLWRQWCRIWPQQYGHSSLGVGEGYDPVFDVIPARMYIDFYTDVTRRHVGLNELNVFEVVDTALNQTPSPETLVAEDVLVVDVEKALASEDEHLPLPVVTVELEEITNDEVIVQSVQPTTKRQAKKANKVGVKKSA
ncbi:MAG: hypothetical protein AAF541_07875 [Pseudomonadota bacterium]